jgi:hypothetical protein
MLSCSRTTEKAFCTANLFLRIASINISFGTASPSTYLIWSGMNKVELDRFHLTGGSKRTGRIF